MENKPKLLDIELKDEEFMTIDQKKKVLKHWDSFLKNGCKWEQFTDALYKHLTLHCEFIAHYNRSGFYGAYFDRGEDTVHFLSQFDARKGDPPRSAESGMTWWARGSCQDINGEMINIAGLYIPMLVAMGKGSQKADDIAKAKRLLGKHGLTIKGL